MKGFDPGVVLAALLLCAVGGAMLAIPVFGYGTLVAMMIGVVLSTALMEQPRELAG
jgi:hypothetical protein